MPNKLLPRLGTLVIAAALLIGGAVSATAVQIIDLKGRAVSLEHPARKVLLGDGRFLLAFGLLTKDPVSRVAGMLTGFEDLDPDGFASFLEAYPALADVPVYGDTSIESGILESALAVKPDAAIFDLGGHGPTARSRQAIEMLTAAGVPIVFIDFRDNPIVNTPRSMRILGQVLGLQAKADAFAKFYESEVSKVTSRMVMYSGPRPTVFLDVRAGDSAACCFTVKSGMLASLIEAAGGRNIAKSALPDTAGQLKPEFIIASNPDVYIGTAVGSRSRGWTPGGPIVLGAGIDEVLARRSLISATLRPDIASLGAVDTGRAFGIWHHFTNSPMNVYALQEFATWLHPELFTDLEPQKTRAALMSRLLPAKMDGIYAIGTLPMTENKLEQNQ
jgi:iron complex transport system substrate-binding protein